MPTRVKVRKWGTDLGIRLPKLFAARRAIVEGSIVEIDGFKPIAAEPRRRSRYKLKDLLKNYLRPPRHVGFAKAGKEIA